MSSKETRMVEARGTLMRRAAPTLLATCVLLLFGGAMFRPVLFQDRQFAFQDAGHYYYPLLRAVQQEWEAGRVPLWTQEAGAGSPLLGNPTAAVLYPGKLVFFVLPHPWAVRLFLVGHVGLAYLATWWLLRGWSVSVAGSILGATAYAFGVPVLSQTSNMIFLVGAAWTPLGLLAADRLIRCCSRAALPALGAVLAMQVLGGDPEAACLTLAAAGAYALGLFASRFSARPGRFLGRLGLGVGVVYLVFLGLSYWSARAIHQDALNLGTSSFKPPIPLLAAAGWVAAAGVLIHRARQGRVWKGFATTSIALVGAGVLALAISGAQLLPCLEYTGMSFRAAASEGFHDVYPYSLNPLQLLDAAWPGIFGRGEAGYRSWLNALPPKPNSRLWMPSIYLGGLTLVLAASAIGVRNGPPWRGWLTGILIASVLAAFGYYGAPMLWLRCVPGWAAALGPIEPPFTWQVRNDGHLRDGDGGVYWFLASVLPGFRSFRYPAKLMVFASLALAGLAALGWEGLLAGRSRRVRSLAGFAIAVGAAALAASWLRADSLRAGFETLAERLRTTDEPLDAARAVLDLRGALLHGTSAAAVTLGLAFVARRRPRIAGAIAVAFLMLDLGVANFDRVVTVPQSTFEGSPRALEIIRAAERADPSPGPFRVERIGRWWPSGWAGRREPRDFEAIARWERETLRPNHQLPLGIASTFYLDTIEPLDYGLFFLPWSQTPDDAVARVQKLKPGQKVWYHPRRGFDLWNTRYFIVPSRVVWDSPVRGYASIVPRSTFLYPKEDAFEGPDGDARRADWEANEDFRILRNEDAYPRAWIVHRARLLPKIQGLAVADRTKIMQEILYQGDDFWRLPGATVRDPRVMAWVETDRPGAIDPLLSRAEPDPSETVAFLQDGPQRVELSAVLRSPGLVVVSDFHYPGWKVAVDGKPAEILRTNRAMRGVALTAGTHRLVFEYDPDSFRVGVGLSIAGLVALAALIARSFFRSASAAGRTVEASR